MVLVCGCGVSVRIETRYFKIRALQRQDNLPGRHSVATFLKYPACYASSHATEISRSKRMTPRKSPNCSTLHARYVPNLMAHFLKQLILTFTILFHRRRHKNQNLTLGLKVIDDEVTRRPITLTTTTRRMHIAVLGKSGSGKSSLLKYMSQQDIEADRGFVYFDLHGDATPFLLKAINARERRLHRDLSGK